LVFRKRSEGSARYYLMKVAANARVASVKLERKAMSLISRSRIYMEMMDFYNRQGASDIVSHISKDLNKIRTAAEKLLWLSRILEWVAIRAETLAIAGLAYHNVFKIVDVLKEIKRDIVCKIPEISIMISEIEEPLEKACSYILPDIGDEVNPFVPSKEALDILREAEEVAKNKLRESMKLVKA